jgi:YesN/AraC family two-component response regulator
MVEETMKKILVIEDSAETRNLFLEWLNAEGFYALAAENGLIGVQQAQKELPDLIICDIMMPQLDGYGVLTTLRQEPSSVTIPFIFVTAKVTWADFRKGMELGADDYLTKPCTKDELLKAISARLEKQAALRKWFTASAQLVSEPSLTDTGSRKALESLFPSVPQLRKVFDFIEANYHQPITVEEVAQVFSYSPTYLTNLVQKQTGQSLYRWIVSRRMAQARSLLLETDQAVEQIAEAVGYHHAVHFFRQFRQHHGTTPQAWRSQHRS